MEGRQAMIRKHLKIINAVQRTVDFLLVLIAFLISSHLETVLFSSHVPFLPSYLSASAYILIALLHIGIYQLFHLYRSHRSVPFWIQTTEIARANLAAYGVMAAVFYQLSLFAHVQIAITLFFFVNTALLLLFRWGMYRVLSELRRKGYNRKYIILVGYNDCVPDFVQRVRRSPGFGYEILGYLAKSRQEKSELPFLGEVSGLEEFLRKTPVDEAFVMLREEEGDAAAKGMEVLEKYGIKFTIIPNLFSLLPSRVYLTSFDDMPVLGMRKIPLDSPFHSFLKRCLDVATAFVALLVFSPVMLGLAIAVKVSSPGPVIFRQVRVGMDRKPFVMYKFRSMRTETQSMRKMASEGDERCTRVGEFLRRYSLDELPQLVNVLKGDMSLVGPRPEIPSFVEEFLEYIPSYMLKHYVRPGMTGWAQIHGLRGGDTSIRERVEYDIDYIENWSFWLDVYILFQTAFRLRAKKAREKGAGKHGGLSDS